MSNVIVGTQGDSTAASVALGYITQNVNMQVTVDNQTTKTPGKIMTGRLSGDILKEYGANAERERDRLAMARIQQSGVSGSAASGALVEGF